MILKTNTMIPQVYGKERTMQVFTSLLDIIINCFKYDIDNMGSIYDANTCPEEFLPLLAKTLNYDYNFNDTVTSNRKIIKTFTELEKYRGSHTSLLIATALGLTTLYVSENNAELNMKDIDSDVYYKALQEIHITYDLEEGLIVIDYPNTYNFVRNLLDYVRPVGMRIKIRSIESKDINTDVMYLYADTENLTREYNPNIDSAVNSGFVNFSTTGDPEYKEILSNTQESDSNEGGDS